SDGIDGVAMARLCPDDVRTALRQGDGRECSQQDRRDQAPATKTILAEAFHGLLRLQSTQLSRSTSSIFTCPASKSSFVSRAHPIARCGILRTNAPRTERRAGDSDHCHAQGYQSERRHFRRMVDLANGPRQRNSRGENRTSARRYCSDGRNVVFRACAWRGSRKVLCACRENRTVVNDDSGGGRCNALS